MLGMTADVVFVAAVVVLYDIFVVVVGVIVVAVAAAAVAGVVVAGIFAAVLFTDFCRKSRQSVNTPPPRLLRKSRSLMSHPAARTRVLSFTHE